MDTVKAAAQAAALQAVRFSTRGCGPSHRLGSPNLHLGLRKAEARIGAEEARKKFTRLGTQWDEVMTEAQVLQCRWDVASGEWVFCRSCRTCVD